jgi:hypothetical protein
LKALTVRVERQEERHQREIEELLRISESSKDIRDWRTRS